MARSQWILPRADSACGKVFHPDRRAAEGHRVALEFWNQATGQSRKDCRLAVYRCKRCGGFHIGNKRIEQRLVQTDPFAPPCESEQSWAVSDLDGEQSADRSQNDIDRLANWERLRRIQEAWNLRLNRGRA
jgi:hypothetical protein